MDNWMKCHPKCQKFEQNVFLRIMLIKQSYCIGKSDISLTVFSSSSAKTNVGWGGKLNGHLISCIRNIPAKNYQNLTQCMCYGTGTNHSVTVACWSWRKPAITCSTACSWRATCQNAVQHITTVDTICDERMYKGAHSHHIICCSCCSWQKQQCMMLLTCCLNDNWAARVMLRSVTVSTGDTRMPSTTY